jgi:hypothetical protein
MAAPLLRRFARACERADRSTVCAHFISAHYLDSTGEGDRPMTYRVRPSDDRGHRLSPQPPSAGTAVAGRRMLTTAVCLLASIVVAAAAAGQDRATPRDGKRAFAIRVADNTVDVDGRLDEPAWEQAPAIDDFVQKEPIEAAPPTERMTVRFVYDESALYIGARMYKNPGSPVQAPMGRRDRVEQAENIQVALDTFHDRRTAYVFGVTTSGVRIDRFHPEDNESTFDDGFDPVWQARTHSDEQGWTAELWIPFSQLRFTAAPEQRWGLNVRRSIPPLDEEDYWVPIPRTVTAWASRFGELDGIRNVASSRRLELRPYVAGASTMTARPDPGNPFDRGGNRQLRVGADVKMGVGPNLTLDATINPDFGQVESDPAEVNLSGVETFFDEKRPFFTEGSGLLNLVPVGNFFYSRRIGAPPIVQAAGDYVDTPAASTILGAAKLTGRTASGTSIGALGAVAAAEDATIFTRSSGLTTNTPVAPRTTYGAVRIQQEFGRNRSTFSGMTTMLHRDLERDTAMANLVARNAFTAAGDSVVRFKEGEYVLTSWAGMSLLTGEPDALARVQRSSAHYSQRPDRDYLIYDPTLTRMSGYKVGASLQRQGGRHWIWTLQHDNESPNLDLNDLGRLTAGDGLQFIGDLRYRETAPGRVFRSYWIGTRQTNEWNYGGDHVVKTAQIYTNQVWRNFWTTTASYTHNRRRQDARLTRGGPLMEVPRAWTANAQLRNRASAQTSWNTQIVVSGNEDGGLSRQLDATIAFRPAPRWQLSIMPSFLRQVDTQQYITSLAGGGPLTYGRRYVFGEIDRSTYATQFRLTYTLKPDLTLDVYAEPFAASGSYSRIGELAAAGTRARRTYGTDGSTAVKQQDGRLMVTDGGATFTVNNSDFNVRSFRSNVVLRWEYRPGSTMYLVWQQDRRVAEAIGDRVGFGDPFRSLGEPGNNYFVIKTTFWMPR